MTETTYVRKATGLVREFSAVDMFFYNIAVIMPIAAIAVLPMYGAYLWPGSSMILSLSIGSALGLLFALTAAMLAAAMPRSGGDYVWGSYLLHPAIGFMISFAWLFALGFSTGTYANWAVGYGSSSLLATLGFIFHNPGWISLGSSLATSVVWRIIFSFIIVWAATALLIFGARFVKVSLAVLFGIAMAGFLIIIALLFTHTNAQFASSFTNLTGVSYQQVITNAQSQGFTIAPFSMAATLSSLIIGWWATFGYTWSIYLGGEVKTPKRTQPLAIVAALVVCWILMLLVLQPYYNVVGWNFVHATSYLWGNNPTAYYTMLPADPLVTFFVSMLTTNPILVFLCGFSFIAACIGTTICYPMAMSRTTFAWAFNRMLPTKTADVSDRYHTPWVMQIIMGVIVSIITAVCIISPSSILINFESTYCIIFFLTGVAALIFPFRKRDVFEASPGVVKKRIGKLPILCIVAIGNCALFLYLFVTAALTPAYSGPVGLIPWSLLIALFLIALIVYYGARTYRRRQGIDVDLLWREIPPE